MSIFSLDTACIAEDATKLNPALVTALLRARSDAEILKPFALHGIQLSIADAYRYQDAVDQRLRQQGHVIAGFKVAFTTPQSLQHWGVDEPCFAPLYWNQVLPHRAVIDADKFIKFHIEAEVAVLLKKSVLVTPESIDDLMNHVASVHLCFDIPDLRYDRSDQKIDGADLVADGLGATHWSIGMGVAPQHHDLDEDIELYRDGKLHSSGPATANYGGCWSVLNWLAKKRIKQGRPLLAGQMILTGPLGKAYFPKERDLVRGTYQAKSKGLGELTIHLE